jgi:beta-galactosidase GanA
MKEAGITRIRMGKFAWHRFEVHDGVYTFERLEDVMKLFGR